MMRGQSYQRKTAAERRVDGARRGDVGPFGAYPTVLSDAEALRAPAGMLSQHSVVHLQQAIGNMAVRRLLATQAQPSTRPAIQRFSPTYVTQHCITDGYAESLQDQELMASVVALREHMATLDRGDALYRSDVDNLHILRQAYSRRTQSAVRGLNDDELEARQREVRQQLEGMGEGHAEHWAHSTHLRLIDAELAARGRSDALSGHFTDIRGAAANQHRPQAAELVNYVRDQMTLYPALIDDFVRQPMPPVNEKVRIIGLITAAKARTEFLLGRIYYRNSGNWEENADSGFMVNHYTDGTPMYWCSRFATTVLGDIVGDDGLAANSGYRIANPHHSGGAWNYDLDYGEQLGGDFAGIRHGEASAQNSPWRALRNRLNQIQQQAQPDATPAQAVDQFFGEHIHPQAGDIMVVTRGGASANSFGNSAASHTTVVERVDGHTIYTIEGNVSSEVKGAAYDLTNPADVGKIVFVARPSLATGRDENVAGAVQADPTAETGASRVYTEEELLAPVRRINELLQQFAADQGWVGTTAPGQADVVANID